MSGSNTGDACVGNIGSAERFNCSAVGDMVDGAARTESACEAIGYDIVVTRATAARVPGFAFLDAGGLKLGGRTDAAALLLLVGDETVRASTAFEFARRYLRLVVALALSSPGAAAEMADCRALAAALDPRLLVYLDRLPGRIGDFRETVPPRITLAGGTEA